MISCALLALVEPIVEPEEREHLTWSFLRHTTWALITPDVKWKIMKILSFNIYEGARPQGKDQTAAVLDVIREADSDLVGLCECTGFHDIGVESLGSFYIRRH
jgi:hypothetical protein